MEVEKLSFPTPWPASVYRYELQQNKDAYYFVARPQFHVQNAGRSRDLLHRLRHWMGANGEPEENTPPLVGYGGLWMIVGEAHISQIAVHPDYRGKKLGELLLVVMIERAMALNAEVVTLEVRVSNSIAQNLYRKYGFQQVGVRKAYYSDNNEDAYLMSTDRITAPAYQEKFRKLEAALRQYFRSQPLSIFLPDVNS
ncbi:MAG: ribosomal protein S18-alanine N-acetyltransferase [Chloroflexi bacterium]|nr:ribosomal protein S18-alanine N-acetyltransferase [Chloroflexota bacterium]